MAKNVTARKREKKRNKKSPPAGTDGKVSEDPNALLIV